MGEEVCKVKEKNQIISKKNYTNVCPACDNFIVMYVRNTVFKRKDRRIMFPGYRFLIKRFSWKFTDV